MLRFYQSFNLVELENMSQLKFERLYKAMVKLKKRERLERYNLVALSRSKPDAINKRIDELKKELGEEKVIQIDSFEKLGQFL